MRAKKVKKKAKRERNEILQTREATGTSAKKLTFETCFDVFDKNPPNQMKSLRQAQTVKTSRF
jgi:hypothetical protein